jgi:hypothetical protein
MIVNRLLSSIVAVLISAHAQAEEVTRSAKSGEPSVVRRYFAWKADCSFQQTKIRMTARPQHGKIVPRFGDHVLAAADLRSGTLGRCEGRKIRDVELYYTSNRGFVGEDRFSVYVTAPTDKPFSDDILIEVK